MSEDVYELAASLVDSRWSKPTEPVEQKVRRILAHHPGLAGATTSEVAATLGLHPRTFQRRLREEGVRFDAIKDELCRAFALSYLRDTRLPLTRIAGLLGYREPASFSRRCQHWFARAPRDVRRAPPGS